MAHTVTLIPGDGAGPELAAATLRVLGTAGVELDWDVQEAHDPDPGRLLESVRANGVALTTAPVDAALRAGLGLYGEIRPCKTYPGLHSRYPDVDLVLVRETTEDAAAAVELEEGTEEADELLDWLADRGHDRFLRDSGLTVRPISETATRRIVQLAFDHARGTDRRRVTAVHKASALAHTDGLWLDIARDVAADNTDIEFGDTAVDDLCLELVQQPEAYDVLVLPSLYGEIVAKLCAGLIGGPDVAPGLSVGSGVAVFEPAHGPATTNPIATILSGTLLLRHLGEGDAADTIERAVAALLAAGPSVTHDLKTSEVADAIVEIAGAALEKLEVLP
jgi:isocitrate dehydrogenase (NAD+)